MAAAQTPPPLRAQGRARRRIVKNKVAELGAMVAAFGAVAVLGIVVWSVLQRGIPALNLDLFIHVTSTFPQPGDGIKNAIVGSIIVVALAAVFALPIGVMIAIYFSEFAHAQIKRYVQLSLDVLNGMPSIVIGIFVYALLVVGSGQAAWKGSFALAIIMLPLVARSTMEVLNLVPASLRQASFALGVAKWRTVLFVIFPTVRGGILTGSTLAVARAAGETAPLLFTTSIFLNGVVTDPGQAMATLPFTIFVYSEAPSQTANDQAWAAAFILMVFVLVLSLTARYLLTRSERKLKGR
ncbi:MAG: phosphate ABC transporter permease PtsA [Candidatus Rokuibacteriota bacterium]|nr:MAG: phosphate ABC transporter permease PtsA [Candidatus Rokubacteria bacterium]